MWNVSMWNVMWNPGLNGIRRNLAALRREICLLARWAGMWLFENHRVHAEAEWQRRVRNLTIIGGGSERSVEWKEIHRLSREYFPGRWLTIRGNDFYQYPLTIEEYVEFMKSSCHLASMGAPESIFYLMEFWIGQTKPNVQPDIFLRTLVWSYTLELSDKLPRNSSVAVFFLDYIEESFFIHGEPEFFRTFFQFLEPEKMDIDNLWLERILARIHAALRARLRLETEILRRKVIWEALGMSLTPALVPGFLSILRECLREADAPPGRVGSDVSAVTKALIHNLQNHKTQGGGTQDGVSGTAPWFKTPETGPNAHMSLWLNLFPSVARIFMEQLARTDNAADWQPILENLFCLEPLLPPSFLEREYHVCRMKQKYQGEGFVRLGELLFSAPRPGKRQKMPE